jgi:hypothetical protein
MSSISNISGVSSATNPYQVSNQNGFAQTVQDFKAIGSALQSGNVANAQSALATFQQNLTGSSQTTTSQPFGKNSQANTDYQSLTNSLQSGDLAGAQKAFTSLKNDLNSSPSTSSAQAAHKGHHHHHHAASATSPTTSPSSASSSDGTLNVTA